MATEQPGFVFTAPAGADLSASQFCFVKLNSSGQVVVCSAITDIPCGILQTKPNAAGQAAVVMADGISKVVGGADLTKGNTVGTDTSGRAVSRVPGTDTTAYIVGQVLVDNSATNGYAKLLFSCMAPNKGS